MSLTVERTSPTTLTITRRFKAPPERVFAAHVEPDSQAIAERLAAVVAMRERGEATLPTTIGEERATNPFLRAADAAELARLRTLKDSFG